MSKHGPEHDALVRAVVVGERSPDDAEVVRRRASCAVCGARLDRLAAVAAALDEEAREELAILALAETVPDAPGADRIEAFRQHPEFRRAPSVRAQPAPRPTRLRPWWAAAAGIAAAVLALVLYQQRGTGGPPPEPGNGGPSGPLLGEEEAVILLPFNDYDDNLVFRIQASPAIAADVAKWELIVEEDAVGDGFNSVIPTTATTWSDPAQVREFPDAITVTVRALNASGVEVARSAAVSGRRKR